MINEFIESKKRHKICRGGGMLINAPRLPKVASKTGFSFYRREERAFASVPQKRE